MASHQYSRLKNNELSSSDSEPDSGIGPDSKDWQSIASQRRRRFSTLVTITIAIFTMLSLSFAVYRFVSSRSYDIFAKPSPDPDTMLDFHDMTDSSEQHSRWQTPDGVWTNCGRSPHEAVSRNCTFDIMAAVWLPQPCYNEAFALETAQIVHLDASAIEISPLHSLSMTNLTWHSERNLLAESFIPLPDLAEYFIERHDKGEKLLAYSIENFHVVHCLYMMRSALMAMQRVAAGEKNVYVHAQAMGAQHSEHCNDVIMNHEVRKTGVTELEFGMGWCHKLS